MYTYTCCLFVVILLFSLLAWQVKRIYYGALLYPYGISNWRQLHPLLSSGFIHANGLHLGINLFLLYTFGNELERLLLLKQEPGIWIWLIWLIGSVMACTADCLLKRNHSFFCSCGASSGIMALMGAYFLMEEGFAAKMFRHFTLSSPAVYLIITTLTLLAIRFKKDQVNYISHLVGLCCGFSFAFFLK